MSRGLIVFLVLFAIIATSLVADAKKFKPLRSVDGSSACALDSPTTVIPLSELRTGIPSGVPDAVRCAFGCDKISGCTSFNCRQPRTSSTAEGQCELYTTSPRSCATGNEFCEYYQCELYTTSPKNCATGNEFCEYYQATDISSQCQLYSDFSNIPTTNMYVKPIFLATQWFDAFQLCSAMGASSHLVVFRSQQEYDSVVQYISARPSAAGATPSCTSGYWTAKRRLNTSTTSSSGCLQSPFVWYMNGTTSGQLPAQSWESSMWNSGEPSCGLSDNQFEACVQLCGLLSWCAYKLNDAFCTRVDPICPLCQVDAN